MKQIKLLLTITIIITMSIHSKYINMSLDYKGLQKIVNSKGDIIHIKKNFVLVLGKQGGFFKYNKIKKNYNNGCTIFNGWERITNEPTVNIMWCGAKGNGIDDDTKAFHRALKVAYTYRKKNRGLYLPTGTYKITKKTIIPSMYKGKSNNYFTIFGDGSYDAGQTQIYFINPQIGNNNDPIEYWIESKIQGLTLKNIRFKQIYPKGKNIYSYKPFGLLRAKTTSGNGKNRIITADTDTAIMNCTFARFYTVIENWGRGLRFSNNTASQGYNPIVLEWDAYPVFPKGIGKDSTGFRAFNITSNRFHSNGSYAIVNKGKNAKKIHSILISDTLLDIGRGIFQGVLVDGSINSTVSTMTPDSVLDLYSGSHNYQINGLVASGTNNIVYAGKRRKPNNFIILRGKQRNGQFNNINLDNCRGDAIIIKGEKLYGIQFNNIVMDNIGKTNNNSLFNFSKNIHNVSIDNLFYSGKIKLKKPIYIQGNSKGYNVHTKTNHF